MVKRRRNKSARVVAAVVCPTCNVAAGQECLSSTGKVTKPHAARWIAAAPGRLPLPNQS